MFIIYFNTSISFYPGTGTEKDKGDFNNSLNIPLPAGTNSENILMHLTFVLKD